MADMADPSWIVHCDVKKCRIVSTHVWIRIPLVGDSPGGTTFVVLILGLGTIKTLIEVRDRTKIEIYSPGGYRNLFLVAHPREIELPFQMPRRFGNHKRNWLVLSKCIPPFSSWLRWSPKRWRPDCTVPLSLPDPNSLHFHLLHNIYSRAVINLEMI